MPFDSICEFYTPVYPRYGVYNKKNSLFLLQGLLHIFFRLKNFHYGHAGLPLRFVAGRIITL
jgi:hypothetical protein